MKQPINDNALKLLNLTIDDYLLWCKCHNYSINNKKIKTEFFRLFYDRVIIKKHGKLYENGEELLCETNN